MQSFRFVKLTALSLTAVAALLALPAPSEAHSQQRHHRHKHKDRQYHGGHHGFPYWAWFQPFYAPQRHHGPSWRHRAPHYRSHCGQRFHSDDAYRRHMHRHHRDRHHRDRRHYRGQH